MWKHRNSANMFEMVILTTIFILFLILAIGSDIVSASEKNDAEFGKAGLRSELL